MVTWIGYYYGRRPFAHSLSHRRGFGDHPFSAGQKSHLMILCHLEWFFSKTRLKAGKQFRLKKAGT